MRILHTYRRGQYQKLCQSLESSGCAIFSATELSGNDSLRTKLSNKACAVDVSSYAKMLDSDSPAASMLELLLHQTPTETYFISDEQTARDHDYEMRTLFNKIDPIEIETDPNEEDDTDRPRKTLARMTDEEVSVLLTALNEGLIGQNGFKAELKRQVRSFRVFHPIDEQPVLSMLLLGPSGVGKTEVARVLCRALAPGEPLPKVNFGNYSSKDALNSLIGSPRGYMGSETGELTLKLEASNAGILLVDEFEKADGAVWNFFLDLLESGGYTDSMGGEHDLSGYIIVFTSNTPKDRLRLTFPPELLSRFNMKVNFSPLSVSEKRLFVEKYASRIASKINGAESGDKLPDDFVPRIVSSVDCTSIDNIRVLRDITRRQIADEVTRLRTMDS